MRLPREYFNIVYSTYARIDNPVLAERVFDLFDKNHDGFFEYSGAIGLLITRMYRLKKDMKPMMKK